LKDRALYLEHHAADRANGLAPARELQMKTTPVMVTRPRTRDGFFPAFPPQYQHHIPADYPERLEPILLEAKSFRAALRTLQTMGLSSSLKELEAWLSELEQEAKLLQERPLNPDGLIRYIDAQELDLKEEHDPVKKAAHCLALGVHFEGRQEVLCSRSFWGHELLECCKPVLVGLQNRGLTRFLLLVTDDFSGLKNLVQGFWPLADHQLCTVHLFRKAQRQLRPADYTLFDDAWREIINASSIDPARSKGLALLAIRRPDDPSWVDHLQPRTDHYWRFMNYPQALHRNLRSTHLPEGINKLIETLRRHAGGHFPSEREAKIKMKLLIDQLAHRKWAKPNPMIKHHLPTLNRIFKQRFEAELTPDHFLTQNF
jgi:transposase-like protein